MYKLFKALSKQEKIILLLLAFYAACIFMFDGEEARIKFVYIAYGALCVYLVLMLRRFSFFGEAKFFVAYLIFGVFSLLWAEDRGMALSKVRTVFLLVVFLVLVTTCIVKVDRPVFLLIALAIGSVALSTYMFSQYGVSGVLSAIREGEERLGWDINNVNAIANSLVVGIIALTGLSFFYKKWIGLLLLLPLGACFLAAGSRTATFSLLIGILALIYVRIRAGTNASKRLSRLILAVMFILFVWLVVRNIPATRHLVLRIENIFAAINGEKKIVKESSTETRMDFIRLGWQQFLRSPIWGNGIGCAGYAMQEEYGYVTYLHNNYIEILASGGIIGFFLYYTPYFVLLISFLKRIVLNREKDPVLLISLSLLITKLVSHFGTVMYYSKIEFLFLALLVSVANIPRYKNQKTLSAGRAKWNAKRSF